MHRIDAARIARIRVFSGRLIGRRLTPQVDAVQPHEYLNLIGSE